MNLFIAALGFSLASAAVIGLAAVSFTLQFAVSDIINLAAGEFLTLGAYLTYAARLIHIPLWPGALLAILVAGVLGVAVNHFCFRPLARRGVGPFSLMVVTFALSIIIQNMLVVIFGPSSFTLQFGGSTRAIALGAFVLTTAQLITIAVAVFAFAATWIVLHRTTFGISVRAVVNSPSLARASGIHLERISDGAWFLAAALGAVAGIALTVSTSSADSQLGYNYLLYFMPAAFFGGMGKITGAVIGAALVAFATTVGSLAIGSQYENVFALGILVVVILIKPDGLMGTIRAPQVEH